MPVTATLSEMRPEPNCVELKVTCAKSVELKMILVLLSCVVPRRSMLAGTKIVLEVKEEKLIEAIKPSMPRVSDIFQTYMRELRAGDLNGSAGLFRLKEELTRRVNTAVAPQQVSAVLFKEIVIQ